MGTISPSLGVSFKTGGTWTITPDPSAINASTGDIDDAILDAGEGSGTEYTVTYTSPGGVVHTDTFTYCKKDDSSFTYASGINDEQTSVVPDSITTSGGLFTMNGVSDTLLTLTGNAVDTETLTLGATTYTFLDTFVDSANNVHIGATASDTIDNLISAITGVATGSAVEGTDFATGQTANASVTAVADDGDTMYVYALTGGTAGNSIASTETMSNGSFTGATLLGGTASETINFSTGLINPSVLGVGSYQVTYSLLGTGNCNTCESITRVIIRVQDKDSADFTIGDQCIL